MFPKLATVVKLILATVTVVMTFYSFLLIGPIIESRIFPVIDKLHILEAQKQADGALRIKVWANKLRMCEYVGISWYRGSASTSFTRVPIILKRTIDIPQDPTRPLGPQVMGPWYISLSIEELYNNSFAEITYRCHILWPTVNRVFP